MSHQSHAALVEGPDTLIRAAKIYSMRDDRAIYRAMALRGEWIVAVSEEPHGLDALITAEIQVVDAPDLTLMPAFFDTHNHLFEGVQNSLLVPVEQAHSIAEFVELIRQRAAKTPPGQWIQSTNAWNQANLAEKRPPTAPELDQATREHPVFCQRGGHLACVNSLALQLAGITKDTPDPAGGTIQRLPDGSPSGVLLGGAVVAVAKLIPPLAFEDQVAGVQRICQDYAAMGIGSVRAPMIQQEQMLVYQAAWERGLLTLRCQPLINVLPSGSVADRIAYVAQWGVRSGFGDDWLRIWGLKFLMDSGPEGAALEQPYANNPQYSGRLIWTPEDMIAVAGEAVRRGWKIGTHAIGDRAVRTVLDVYERVRADHPKLPPNSLVIEHAFLADREQRARAVRLGVAITVQHPLLYGMAASLIELWGPERARQIMPVRSWVEEGAQISAGTDYPAGSAEPMQAIWGMITRQTRDAGIVGPEHAIDPYTACYLYTAAGAELVGESDRRGTLQPRRLADLVAFPADPIAGPVEVLPTLRPTFTVVGGRAVYDPHSLLAQRTPDHHASHPSLVRGISRLWDRSHS